MEARQQAARTTNQAVVSQGAAQAANQVPAKPPAQAVADEPARRSAYGLPCAKCGMYYESSLPACPICKSPERVSPRSVTIPGGVQTSPTQSLPAVAPGTMEGIPDAAELEEERERFLRELKAQLYQAPVKLHAGEVPPCVRESAHAEDPGAAEICRDCYDHAQESADRMEAALHMDVKEAGKIIYEAVWADTSDPEKTYLNAGRALLQELRTRAGISSAPSAKQKYSH